MRTAIYGGTFNPIHNAHIHLIKGIHSQMNFDRVFVIPTNIPPHKEQTKLAQGEDRMRMCSLALEKINIPFKVLDIELKREGRSYTVDTLKELKSIYPNDTFYLIMGEDMFVTLDKWVRFKEIISKAEICAVKRSENGIIKMEEKKQEYEKLGAKCHILNVEFLDISSTDIRNKIINGEEISELVPREIAEYITYKNLYRE